MPPLPLQLHILVASLRARVFLTWSLFYDLSVRIAVTFSRTGLTRVNQLERLGQQLVNALICLVHQQRIFQHVVIGSRILSIMIYFLMFLTASFVAPLL